MLGSQQRYWGVFLRFAGYPDECLESDVEGNLGAMQQCEGEVIGHFTFYVHCNSAAKLKKKEAKFASYAAGIASTVRA